MSDSEEDRLLLEDESMDEMYELEDALRLSVDTNASSPAKSSAAGRRDESESDSEDDWKIEKRAGESDSDSDSDASSSVEMPLKMAAVAFRDADDGADAGNDDSEDSDEPPEIPGSPLATAQTTRAPPYQAETSRDTDTGQSREADRRKQQQQNRNNSGPSSSGPDILRIRHSDDSESGDDDDYVVKEAEQPRSAEFHASSSSDSEEDEYEGDDDNDDEDGDADGGDNNDYRRSHTRQRSIQQHSGVVRPKTAAKELDLYRDAVPDAFFQQVRGDSGSENASQQQILEEAQNAATSSQKPKNRSMAEEISSRASSSSSNSGATTTSRITTTTGSASTNRRDVYAVPVPQEVADLFHFVDAYSPETVEIGSRLEPFVPDYVPTIGLPFDGVQIPRPDGKIDTEAGLQVLKEPSSSSDVAELELLMQSHLKQQRKVLARSKTPFVHSISDAEHRPTEIDLWIESVAKVQKSKPVATVVYKKSMPTLTSLMELWPEEFETFLGQRSVAATVSSLSTLDVSLEELVKIVCVVLDIPVHSGGNIESLHVLFSLYQEIENYERDLNRRGSVR